MKIFPLHLIPNDTNFNFMRLRWVSMAIAILLAVVSVGSMVYNSATKGAAFNYALISPVAPWWNCALTSRSISKACVSV